MISQRIMKGYMNRVFVKIIFVVALVIQVSIIWATDSSQTECEDCNVTDTCSQSDSADSMPSTLGE